MKNKILLLLLLILKSFSTFCQDNCKKNIIETLDETTQTPILSSSEISILNGKKIDFKINFSFFKKDSVISLKVDYVSPEQNSLMSIFYIHFGFKNNTELWLDEYKAGGERTVVKNKTITSAKQNYFELTKEQVNSLINEEINSVEIRFFDQKEEPVSRGNIATKTAVKIKTVVGCMN